MADQQAHRGARPAGPFSQPGDRRVLEVDDALRTLEASSQTTTQTGYARDSNRAAQQAVHALGKPGRLLRGTVVHAIPHFHWYKVQIAGLGWVPCCDLAATSVLPLGPKPVGLFGPNSTVLVHLPDRMSFGIILGAVPPAIEDGNLYAPDWHTQGGGAGFRREDAHKFPLTGTYQQGGVIDWSAGRPDDETAFEAGWITPLGLRIVLDDYQVQVAVNEMAGLFVNYLDSHTRLAGVQLRIESAAHEESAWDDEGELRYFKGVAVYPWEAIGAYAKGETVTRENDDKAVQYSSFEGKIDLADQKTQPFYRYVEYGGYLGQGGFRAVVAPAQAGGLSRYGDEADPGVFREAIGLDGSYSLVSAKSVHIGKRCIVTVPKPQRLPEDGQGDDGAKDNYKFSGTFGGGAEHKVTAFKVAGDGSKSMLRAAAVLDFIAHACNWVAVHPFHYHENDFVTRQESDPGKPGNRVSGPLAFGSLADQSYLDDPEPVTLTIDPRYGDVDYFERESFLVFHDDGTVQLGGGGGEELVFGGGTITLTAPGGIRVCPGTDLTVLAGQIVLRAKGSVDVSSSEADVRLKAEKNLQALAGNGGSGGVLIESKGQGRTYDYAGKFGEDVAANGVVVRATNGQVGVLGANVYLRTGGEGLGSGNIVLDAGKGESNVYVYGREFGTFSDFVTFAIGPTGEESTVDQVYVFTKDACIIDTDLSVGGRITGYGDSGLTVDGQVFATESIASGGSVSSRDGGVLGQVDDSFVDQIKTQADAVGDLVDTAKEQRTSAHAQGVVQTYYQDRQLGNDGVLRNMTFSFRDPPGGGDQYHTGELTWPESRWQTLARLGGGSGGTSWTERAVRYQGEETMPWPGKAKWRDEAVFLRLDELKMYDAAAGTARDRPGPYEDPQTGTFAPVTMEQGFTLIR